MEAHRHTYTLTPSRIRKCGKQPGRISKLNGCNFTVFGSIPVRNLALLLLNGCYRDFYQKTEWREEGSIT